MPLTHSNFPKISYLFVVANFEEVDGKMWCKNHHTVFLIVNVLKNYVTCIYLNFNDYDIIIIHNIFSYFQFNNTLYFAGTGGDQVKFLLTKNKI